MGRDGAEGKTTLRRGRAGGWEVAAVGDVEGSWINYCLLNNLRALVWAVNLADLELHTFLHMAPATERPTSVVFTRMQKALRKGRVLVDWRQNDSHKTTVSDQPSPSFLRLR